MQHIPEEVPSVLPKGWNEYLSNLDGQETHGCTRDFPYADERAKSDHHMNGRLNRDIRGEIMPDNESIQSQKWLTLP